MGAFSKPADDSLQKHSILLESKYLNNVIEFIFNPKNYRKLLIIFLFKKILFFFYFCLFNNLHFM